MFYFLGVSCNRIPTSVTPDTIRVPVSRVLIRSIRQAVSHIQRRVPPSKSKWQPVRHNDKIKE